MTVKNRRYDANLFFLVQPGTNVRYTVDGSIATVDGNHVDAYVRHINRKTGESYDKIPIDEYHRKFSISKMLGTKLDLSKYNFLVRIGTSERHINFSGDINLCTDEHAEKILPDLNRYGNFWTAMPVEEYYTTFGLIA